MGNLFKNIWRLIVAAIGLVLLGIIAVSCYAVYIDSNSFKAKNYLIEKYDLNEEKLKPKKYIQYSYEDISNCDQQWIKKCTDDENLVYQYVFEYDDMTIVVSEDKKGQLTDDSTLTPKENTQNNE